MFHLIGSKSATCTQHILAITLLAEKGITEFTLYTPGFKASEIKKSPYTDKQSLGVIPVLEDGDFTLHDDKATALFEQWASVELQNYDKWLEPIVDQKFFNKRKGLEAISQVVDFAAAKFNEKLDVYGRILGKKKYTGKLFQISDGELIESRPSVKAWWERVSTRESWKNVLAAATP